MVKQKSDAPEIEPFEGPAGGWGSVRSLAEILPRERVGPEALRELVRQNKPDNHCKRRTVGWGCTWSAS